MAHTNVANVMGFKKVLRMKDPWPEFRSSYISRYGP